MQLYAIHEREDNGKLTTIRSNFTLQDAIEFVRHRADQFGGIFYAATMTASYVDAGARIELQVNPIA